MQVQVLFNKLFKSQVRPYMALLNKLFKSKVMPPRWLVFKVDLDQF